MTSVAGIIASIQHSLSERHISTEKLLLKDDNSDHYAIPKEISEEEVLSLLRDPKSLWKLEDDWSDEAVSLRELLATSNTKLTEDFFFSYIRTLRLVDKRLHTIDRTFKMFPFLEDLVLSLNYLEDIDPKLLPTSLLLLELNRNRINFKNGSGKLLKKGIKKLKHLGVGGNQLVNMDWFQTKLWPNLVSLDLSNNDLFEYKSTIEMLASIKGLKALVLSGNPLSMIAGYRAGIVQHLGYIHALDDLPIAADETLNASPIEAAVRESNISELYTKSQFQIRQSSSITGLPQPPLLEATQQNADWFFRWEFCVPKSMFEMLPGGTLEQPTTIFNVPTDGHLDAPVQNTKTSKTQSAEKLPPAIEFDFNDALRICSQAVRYQQSLNMSSSFQPILNTSGLTALRDHLLNSSFKVVIALIVRTMVPQEGSRPPSSLKKEKHKESKEGKKKQPVNEVLVPHYERHILAEASFATNTIALGSAFSTIVKLKVPSAAISQVVEQLEKSRPPSTTKKGTKKSPIGDRKSPKFDKQRSSSRERNGTADRKSPREKTPPAKANKAAAQAAPPDPTQPPPPDLQASFTFELFHLRSAPDVNKWVSAVSHKNHIMSY